MEEAVSSVLFEPDDVVLKAKGLGMVDALVDPDGSH